MNNKLRLTAALTLCLVGALALGAGCGDVGDASPPVATGSLPVDVARVITANCVSCHATQPRYGAPMALVTYADTQRAAASNRSRKVWQLMGERVHDAVSPMPATRLSTSDLAVIDAWVAAGAPACTGAMCGSVNPTANTAVVLPCTPTNTFSAHATGGGGFTVPPASGNLNKCFAFRSPFTTTTQAIAFGPHVDNTSVLHHMILFSTNTPQTDGAVFDCDGHMPGDIRFVTGWAPGNMGTVLPADVGVELPGEGTWFILQVHYWNLQNVAGADGSGLAMCTTTELRPHAAAVHMLGTLNLAIPPRAQGFEVSGTCTPAITEPVHIIGAAPHMHRLGNALNTQVLRGGRAQDTSMLVDVQNYSFNSQVSYRADMLLMPGDVLRTTCRYTNNSASTVYFGERTEDEMCFDFVLAWPAGALSNAGGASTRRCIDPQH